MVTLVTGEMSYLWTLIHQADKFEPLGKTNVNHAC